MGSDPPAGASGRVVRLESKPCTMVGVSKCPKSSDRCPNNAVVWFAGRCNDLAMQVADTPTHHRLDFKGLHFSQRPDDRFFVGVGLASTGKLYVGTAEGPRTEAGELECAARAAIRALESAAGHRVGFELRRVMKIGEFNAILVVLSLLSPVGDHAQLLCGSCLVNGTPLNAAVKAVLKATNRLFEANLVNRRQRVPGIDCALISEEVLDV